MFEDVERKLQKKNKILFSRDSPCLQELIILIRKQNHKTLILWAFACVKIPLEIFEKQYPLEKRPRVSVELAYEWAHGNIKMPVAKRAILDCHEACKTIDDAYYVALGHAIGQGVSTVHVESHAIGLPFYELTAIVLKDKEQYEEAVMVKIAYYIETLQYIEAHIQEDKDTWADFIVKPKLNKEDEVWKKLPNNCVGSTIIK